MKKHSKIFITVIILITIAFVGLMGNNSFWCKPFNGQHQQLLFKLKDGRIYGECGSCGDYIPIRPEYNKDAMLFKVRIKIFGIDTVVTPIY